MRTTALTFHAEGYQQDAGGTQPEPERPTEG